MDRLFRMLILAVLSFTICAHGQVRIVQWSDAHSTTDTLTKQLYEIDQAGQKFKQLRPKGEFIVHVLGDLTSIQPYSLDEQGWISIRSLKFLVDRGYTVLFTPGNHDAFDWNGRIDGVDLFIEQMKYLKSIGVKILLDNLNSPQPILKSLIIPKYDLKTLTKKTSIVGLTLPVILRKSKLNEENILRLFESVESFEETFQRILPDLEAEGYQSVLVASHQGFGRMRKELGKVRDFIKEKNLSVKIPLIMASHDHRVVAFRERGTHFVDGGSHGSFNIIDLKKNGEIRRSVIHKYFEDESLERLHEDLFAEGEIAKIDVSKDEVLQIKELKRIQKEIETEYAARDEKLLTEIFNSKGYSTHRDHLKQGRYVLGNLLAEALRLWAEDSGFQVTTDLPYLSMANSSSYHLEEGIQPGAVSELTLRSMYPHLSRAKAYEMNFSEAKQLFFSLRNFYGGGAQLYTPQINRDYLETDGELKVLKNGKWVLPNDDQKIVVVIDGWLAEHSRGQGYQIPEWLDLVGKRNALDSKSYQDILVEYLPKAMAKYEKGLRETTPCEKLLSQF